MNRVGTRCLRVAGLTAFIVLVGAVGARAAAGRPAGPASTPAASATRARGSIVMDGRLSEEAWLLAPPLTGLSQLRPHEGQKATERTEVRLVYDDDALYVGARMFDRNPAGVVRRLSRRDADASSDYVRVYLDPHHDHLTGVMLQVSAAGSRSDGWLSNDFDLDLSWDGVWDAAVGLDAEGWTAEIRIPFSQLRFATGQPAWGLNICRYIQHSNEEDWWALVPGTDKRVVSGFGHLDGLAEVRGKSHMDLLPYVTSRLDRDGSTPAGNPFRGNTAVFGGAGLDIKWGITSSMTLDATVNPDFGQVEVDPAVVNLTAFETFFQEKRPFFIEGAQQFTSFGRDGLVLYGRFGAQYPQIMYSRRIGRTPQASAEGDAVDSPTATRILGAAKLTGRTAGGWTVALVDALAGSEWAKVANGSARREVEVEPLTSYTAGRVSRDLGGRGAVGLLATVVRRSPRTEGLDTTLGRGAYVGGVDGHWYVDSGKQWVVSGSFAGSRVTGDAEAIARLQRSSARYFQRPDATHVRLDPLARSLNGWTGQVNLNRTRGSMLVDGALWAISPGFESNDLGYSPEADRVGAHVGWVWRKTTPDRWTRNRKLLVVGRGLWNTAGDVMGEGLSLQGGVVLGNYWQINANADIDLPYYDDRATRGGPLMRQPAASAAVVFVESDTRKRVSAGVGVETCTDAGGGWGAALSPSVTVRPAPSISLSIGPSLLRLRGVSQYVTTAYDAEAVATYGRRAVFADIDRTEASMVTRLNVIFTPRASLELFAQPLVSSGRYWGLKEFARPRTFDFNRYGADVGTIGYDPSSRTYDIDPDGRGPARPFTVAQPDFNYKSLRVNAVFRWEWRAGSTLYVAWTDQREDTAHPGEFRLARDLRSLLGAPDRNVLVVKLSYWFSR